MIALLASIPKHMIRAEQAGDWQYTDKYIQATVDEALGAEENQLAVAIHEVIEAFKCRKHGIPDKKVVEFDEMFEAERKAGKHKEHDEPGDDPRCPYRQEHQDATHVERAVCAALGINWDDHCYSVIK